MSYLSNAARPQDNKLHFDDSCHSVYLSTQFIHYYYYFWLLIHLPIFPEITSGQDGFPQVFKRISTGDCSCTVYARDCLRVGCLS